MTENTASTPPQDELTALAAELDQTETVDGEYQPAPDPAPEKPAGPPTGELIAGLLSITCNKVLAPRRGEHWKLSTVEAEAAGEAYGALIDKYFPDFSVGPEGVAIGCTLMIFGPRLAIDAKVRQAKREAEAEAEEREGANDAGEK